MSIHTRPNTLLPALVEAIGQTMMWPVCAEVKRKSLVEETPQRNAVVASRDRNQTKGSQDGEKRRQVHLTLLRNRVRHNTAGTDDNIRGRNCVIDI